VYWGYVWSVAQGGCFVLLRGPCLSVYNASRGSDSERLLSTPQPTPAGDLQSGNPPHQAHLVAATASIYVCLSYMSSSTLTFMKASHIAPLPSAPSIVLLMDCTTPLPVSSRPLPSTRLSLCCTKPSRMGREKVVPPMPSPCLVLWNWFRVLWNDLRTRDAIAIESHAYGEASEVGMVRGKEGAGRAIQASAAAGNMAAA